jgi:hypothetical protein
MSRKKEDYDNIPVTYCKTCLSLHIKTVEFEKGVDGADRSVDYCVPCGNTDLEKVQMSEWEELYKEKYNQRFLN